jgi:hypothetical protein
MSRANKLLIENEIREESIAATLKKVHLMDKARKLGQQADKKSIVNKATNKIQHYSQQAKPHIQSAINAISSHPKTALATAGTLGAAAVASKLRRNRKAKDK